LNFTRPGGTKAEREKNMKKVYDVVQITFKDREHFPVKVIATCKTRQLTRGVIARCNHGFHDFEIVEREARR
jgi:hypothetical protein